MKIGYSTIAWGGVVGHPAGVTAVKDLFYLAHGDTKKAIADIAATGYEGVEMFDGNLAEYVEHPDELLKLLRGLQLELVSVYTGANFIFDDILDDELYKVTEAARLASHFGAERLVVGGGAKRATGEKSGDMARLGQVLDHVADIAAAHGLGCSYHPHLGTIVESPEALDRLMAASKIDFCPDTAHLAAGGGNPTELIEKFARRLSHVHLKDYNYATGEFLPLGVGDLELADIIAAIRATGYDSWLMVELDSYHGDPKEAAEISKRYLDALIAD